MAARDIYVGNTLSYIRINIVKITAVSIWLDKVQWRINRYLKFWSTYASSVLTKKYTSLTA